MAKRQLCLHVGCVNYRCQGSKYCEKHREADEAKDRQRHQEYLNRRFNFQNKTITSDRAKFYQSAKYKRLRTQFLQENPICALCRVNKATEIHHIGENYWNEEDFYDTSMWRGLCHQCHCQVSTERKQGRKN